MNQFNNIADALRVFQAGPTAQGWDHAASYLLDDRTPPVIRDQVETIIADAMKAIYGFTFQPDALTEQNEPVITTRALSAKLGIGEQQLLSWVHWLEKRYSHSKPMLNKSRRLHRLQ
ncbi:MAG: hypothetical protein H6970_13445 [Gammaproteobacteria bacterium]|nr:hypothetical protein [Gammaproteobacteria bacterium]